MLNDENQPLSDAALLAKWLEGELNSTERQAFEQRCITDTDFAERVAQANQLAGLAQAYTPFPTPEWDKQALLGDMQGEQPNTLLVRIWRWSGWPVSALGSAACALLLVLLQPAVPEHEAIEAMISAQVNQQVSDQMLSYQQQQQEVLMAYAQALQRQQQTTQQELTEYVLASNRAQRKEDFSELLDFIAQQRAADQAFYATQFNELENDIYAIAQYPVQQPSQRNRQPNQPNE
jgi:anti-sigma-K factor RskA